MSSFKLAFHETNGRRIVEVYDGDELIAAIYPTTERDIRVISKNPMTVVRHDEPAPSVVQIKFGKLQ